MSHNMLLVVTAAACLAAACSAEPLSVDRCNIRLAVISLDPARLEVGQAVTLEAQLTPAPACLPADAEFANFRWTSDDPGVASIDALTGRVTAIGAGTAQITLVTAKTHTLLTQSSVQVDGT
jgi:Big-like domain-containing protein